MNLHDTINGMISEDYKERFIAEYQQLSVRTEGLRRMVVKYGNGELDFTPNCSLELLSGQLHVMAAYLLILEQRAQIEGIELLKGER